MDNLNLLCQTIRFQRNALQNSLAMINAVQRHGETLLKRTLEQSPWVPGEGRDACLFWSGLWMKNLTGMTYLVDRNLATMECLTATGATRRTRPAGPSEKPADEAQEPPSGAVRQAAPEGQPGEEKPQAEHQAPPAEQVTALAKTQGASALVAQPPPGEKPKPPQGKPPAERKRSAERKPD